MSTHFEQHLNLTLEMLMRAIYIGDSFGSEWLLDVLQKWWGTHSLELDYEHHNIKQSYLYTLDILDISEKEAFNKLEDQSLLNEEEPIVFHFPTAGYVQ